MDFPQLLLNYYYLLAFCSRTDRNILIQKEEKVPLCCMKIQWMVNSSLVTEQGTWDVTKVLLWKARISMDKDTLFKAMNYFTCTYHNKEWLVGPLPPCVYVFGVTSYGTHTTKHFMTGIIKCHDNILCCRDEVSPAILIDSCDYCFSSVFSS